jgi:hypothetical protein
MTISNNTQKQNVYYSVGMTGGSVDCGNLGPGDDVNLVAYDQKPDVKVTLTITHTGDETEFIIQDPGL